MTQDEKLIYLNEIVKNNFTSEYKGPLILYKYRPFDEYTFEMLDNDYIFLCPAEKEDDETECLTTTNLNEMLDPKTGNLSKKYLNKIVSLIKPSSTDKNYEIAKDKVFEIADKEGTNPIIFNKDFAIELKKMAPEGTDVGPIIKAIENIPEMLNKPEMSKTLEPAFKLAIDARKKIGICSLAETNNIDYMWKNYAQESSGYCIEYDLNDYELVKNILPVIYQDERETNIIVQFTGTMLGLLICAISKGSIPADASHFIRLFLTKYKKWEYQNEWRYIGSANDKPKAPKVKTIYLGKNVTAENEIEMRKYAALKSIPVIKLN